jgi:hypothetical protein
VIVGLWEGGSRIRLNDGSGGNAGAGGEDGTDELERLETVVLLELEGAFGGIDGGCLGGFPLNSSEGTGSWDVSVSPKGFQSNWAFWEGASGLSGVLGSGCGEGLLWATDDSWTDVDLYGLQTTGLAI